MEELEKGKVKGFAAHFEKAAAFHKAHGEAHGDAADAHDTMADACKAMHEHHAGKVAKADGTEDDEHKAHATMHKAMHAFHKSMGSFHKAMAKAHAAHGEHCAMCAKMAPENFTTSVSGSEHSGEKTATVDMTKAAEAMTDLLTKTTAVSDKLQGIEAKLAALEAKPEPLQEGLTVVPRPGEGITKAAPPATDDSGGLRKRA